MTDRLPARCHAKPVPPNLYRLTASCSRNKYILQHPVAIPQQCAMMTFWKCVFNGSLKKCMSSRHPCVWQMEPRLGTTVLSALFTHNCAYFNKMSFLRVSCIALDHRLASCIHSKKDPDRARSSEIVRSAAGTNKSALAVKAIIPWKFCGASDIFKRINSDPLQCAVCRLTSASVHLLRYIKSNRALNWTFSTTSLYLTLPNMQ